MARDVSEVGHRLLRRVPLHDREPFGHVLARAPQLTQVHPHRVAAGCVARRVQAIYRRVFGRDATERELSLGVAYVGTSSPPEAPRAQQNWWLVVDGGTVDLCGFDPGYDVDLLVKSSLRAMTAIWMGLSAVRKELDAGHLELDGDPKIATAMQNWLGLSSFAGESRKVA